MRLNFPQKTSFSFFLGGEWFQPIGATLVLSAHNLDISAA